MTFIPSRRHNIQAHIDAIIAGRKYLCELWDDEGNRKTYRLKAKSEQDAFNKACFEFAKDHAS